LAAAGLVLSVGAGVMFSASAHADMKVGNYNLNVVGRYDFHTWLWWATPCGESCIAITGIAQPVARGFNYQGNAPLTNGRYTLTVDVPDGLRCGNVYYGPAIATHDVYNWDATTLAGTLTSTFDAGCDGQPGVLSYPFTVTRM
jgi:hypothetical protein